MALDRKEVEKIAHLARLELADADVPGYVRNLTRILELVEQMNRVDTEAVEPMAHPLDASQRLRPDTVSEGDERERLQAGAPLVADGLYLVPRVLT